MNILVVDDNSDYRELLELALGNEGYTVFSAEDGLEGIEILESHPIDLIISDIRMPRMDGIKLNAYARATPEYKNTKFIFVSGFKEVYLGVVVLDPLLDFFLDKTTPGNAIVQLVHRLLKSPAPQPAKPQRAQEAH